jgi:triosephosphate isomerase (TIM)
MNKVIIGNWKMLLTGQEVKNLGSALADFSKEIKNGYQVVACPSYPYLNSLADQLSKVKNIHLGAQNCSQYEVGAFTGEVSAAMLQDIGVKYVILGHSERRQYFKESSTQIKHKIKMAQSHKLHVILCIGETADIYKNGNSEEFIETQLKHNIPKEVDESLLTIAYEPIWAIGSGFTPTTDEIRSMSMHIKNCTSHKFRIIYGGSVNQTVATTLKCIQALDGLLVGGASTKAMEFINIIKNFSDQQDKSI